MYHLGARSKRNLQGVHLDLVRVVTRAIELTTQDFTVLQGLRTLAEQRDNVRKGASQTMASRHLPGSDGAGHAVDLGAWVDGKVDWTWERYLPIADAMRQAAREFAIPIRYGGGWFELQYLNSKAAIAAATDAYSMSRRAAGAKPFLDGGHFELPISHAYPQ